VKIGDRDTRSGRAAPVSDCRLPAGSGAIAEQVLPRVSADSELAGKLIGGKIAAGRAARKSGV
jgi:hypothetical protein